MNLKRILLILLLIILWFATAIPLGLLAYSMKNSFGWDTFRYTGYHAFNACLKQEYERQKNQTWK